MLSTRNTSNKMIYVGGKEKDGKRYMVQALIKRKEEYLYRPFSTYSGITS